MISITRAWRFLKYVIVPAVFAAMVAVLRLQSKTVQRHEATIEKMEADAEAKEVAHEVRSRPVPADKHSILDRM